MMQGRSESVEERLDRNWNDILQEIRVMQTGVQILAAFLVVLPFQARFTILDAPEKLFYLCLLVFSGLLIILIITPVAVHRHFFGHRVKLTTVKMGHAISKLVILGVGILVSGCVWFVVLVLGGWLSALVVGGSTVLASGYLLVVLPRLIKPQSAFQSSSKGENQIQPDATETP